jgi:hypothetical protein
VTGHNLVIPDRSPSRAVQALDSPSTSDASSGSGDGSQASAYCKGGHAGSETSNPDGSFDNLWLCDGGGITQIENKGQQDPTTGDGAYDQITTYADGSTQTWHFTISYDASTQSSVYNGQSQDGSETYTGTYTAIPNDTTHSHMHEVWNLAAGTYVDDGVVGNDGSFVGTETFDDPNTAASPDWSANMTTNADGSFSQDVVYNGAGFTSDYTYSVAVDGHADYSFKTDLTDTSVNPDYQGSYTYQADGSGQGSYTQNFDDGSTDLVSDTIHADGTTDETWKFDDASTAINPDQTGAMTWHPDGSGEGTVTTFVVGGGQQTCDVHIASNGSQTVDNCH